MALRQACQDEDLKWVSLLMWLGANPRAKGLTTEDLDSRDALEDPDYQQSALQIACRSRKPEILQRLKPNPATDDLRELMAAAASLITTPETVAYLVGLGSDVNDKPDGGSTVLDTCLRHFGWKEAVWDGSYLTYRHSTIPRRGSGSLSTLSDSCSSKVRGGLRTSGRLVTSDARSIALMTTRSSRSSTSSARIAPAPMTR